MNDETRSKIKKITVYTKRITQNTLVGDYLSAFKGRGLEFDQLRDYQIGDDIRFIDWNSSAKMNKMMVKQFVEERDRTIILGIDISSSTFFSSKKDLRSSTISQVATVLAFIATNNKDKVGALFFSDRIEHWIPPKKGLVHYGKILNTIFSIKPERKKTDIKEALKFLISIKKRNAITFLLSDWIDDVQNYSNLLKVASIKFDFVGIRFLDYCEQEIPEFGLIEVCDPETGEKVITDSRVNIFLKQRRLEQEKLFKKYKIDLLDLSVSRPFINPMINFFHQRVRRQI